ncbi:MAG: PilN domain-containing protein [Rubrivivax sp.]
MAQQINLHDPGRRRPRQRLSSTHLGWALLGVLALGSAVSLTLHGLTIHERSRVRDTETELQALRRQGGQRVAPPGRVAELERLQALESGRQRVQRLMEQNRPLAGNGPMGHGAAYFDALSRRANGAVWITAFSVSADGRQLELSGRMLGASALPAYLRSLNEETILRGRPFAELDIRRVGGQESALADSGLVEFSLRSQPPRDEARP